MCSYSTLYLLNSVRVYIPQVTGHVTVSYFSQQFHVELHLGAVSLLLACELVVHNNGCVSIYHHTVWASAVLFAVWNQN